MFLIVSIKFSKLFNGTLEDSLKTIDLEALKQKLEIYFNNVINCLIKIRYLDKKLLVFCKFKSLSKKN
jgi:hypothetical protein